jgi:hypothetical protein
MHWQPPRFGTDTGAYACRGWDGEGCPAPPVPIEALDWLYIGEAAGPPAYELPTGPATVAGMCVATGEVRQIRVTVDTEEARANLEMLGIRLDPPATP